MTRFSLALLLLFFAPATGFNLASLGLPKLGQPSGTSCDSRLCLRRTQAYGVNIRKTRGTSPCLMALDQADALQRQQDDFKHIADTPSAVPKLAGPLNNRYWALRHGQSEANIADIISSDPARGCTIHGLTELGREQARGAAGPLLDAIGRDQVDGLVVYSSNFTRARETAEETCAQIEEDLGLAKGSLQVSIEIGLRERWFGELDNTIITNYNKVWPADMKDATCKGYDVESVDEACQRVKEVIESLEKRHSGKDIVLTSHADTLQILQTYMAGVDPRTFSSFRFKNGEVRPLLLTDEAMPAPSPLTYA